MRSWYEKHGLYIFFWFTYFFERKLFASLAILCYALQEGEIVFLGSVYAVDI